MTTFLDNIVSSDKTLVKKGKKTYSFYKTRHFIIGDFPKIRGIDKDGQKII